MVYRPCYVRKERKLYCKKYIYLMPNVKLTKMSLMELMSFHYFFLNLFYVLCRSSHPDVFCKKGVLRKFSKFTGKHLCQSLYLNKVACLRPATLFKKRLWHRCFPVSFGNSLRTPFLTEHLRCLLL